MFQKLFCTGIFLVATIIASQANAEFLKFQIQWDGTSFGNNAQATGILIVDGNLLPNPGNYFGPFTDSAFLDFEITVSGASIGNGTFSLANGDFEDFVIWDSASNLDLTQDLMG